MVDFLLFSTVIDSITASNLYSCDKIEPSSLEMYMSSSANTGLEFRSECAYAHSDLNFKPVF